ncbi:hypothetical protein D3C80_2190960 [compost metagenome]
MSLAKRISLASASSLPTPEARPLIIAMETTGDLLRRTNMSGRGGRPVFPLGISRVRSRGSAKS